MIFTISEPHELWTSADLPPRFVRQCDRARTIHLLEEKSPAETLTAPVGVRDDRRGYRSRPSSASVTSPPWSDRSDVFQGDATVKELARAHTLEAIETLGAIRSRAI